jgi:hypothetical protein
VGCTLHYRTLPPQEKNWQYTSRLYTLLPLLYQNLLFTVLLIYSISFSQHVLYLYSTSIYGSMAACTQDPGRQTDRQAGRQGGNASKLLRHSFTASQHRGVFHCQMSTTDSLTQQRSSVVASLRTCSSSMNNQSDRSHPPDPLWPEIDESK